MTEMSSYSPLNAEKESTIWNLYEDAAKCQYGQNIKVIKAPWTIQQLDDLKFETIVESADREPQERTRTIVDINMKEYTNRSEKEVDETLVRVRKTSSQSTGSRYQFTSTNGINWDVGGDFGLQVMNLAMAGGSATLSANYGKQKSKTFGTEESTENSFQFSYEQEEKITVPPMTRVKARITTYAMKYEQGYNLRFSLPSTLRLPVWYKTRCQQILCGNICGNTTRFISAAQLLQSLPDYREEDGKVSFVQQGILSWIGEGSTIDKEVEPIHTLM